MRLYDDRFIVGEIPWHSSQGITIYSRKNDTDDGILEFDYGNLLRGSTADYATIVVNSNSNDFSHPDGFFKPNTGYRLRITTDAPKDIVILQEIHNKDVQKEQRIESLVDILASGHIKIIKHNGSFTIFYNSTYQTETLVGNITILTYLSPGRFGFSVGTLEGRYIELDNVIFTSL